MSDLIISDVRTRALRWSTQPTTLQANLVSATSALPYDHSAQQWWGASALTIVEVETKDGYVGIGSAGGFTGVPKPVIDQHLRALVLGMSAYDVAAIWDKLYRSSLRFGQRGVVLAAIAGIDIACYDIQGKALGVPVFNLLGGATKDRIPVYASRLYALRDLDQLAEEARGYVAQGFTRMKQRFGFGPRDGLAGMRANEDLVRTVREAIGPDLMLAADAYMGWDTQYTLEMSRRLAKYDLAWIEDPLQSHDIRGYSELCRRSLVPIAHGEHQYTRYEFATVIEQRAAHILQPDVNRVGGFTEARRICALAEAADIPVVPHSNEMHNVHLVVATPNSPFAEYFPDVLPDTGNELFWRVFHGELVAENGSLPLPSEPGLGISLNEDFIEEVGTT